MQQKLESATELTPELTPKSRPPGTMHNATATLVIEQYVTIFAIKEPPRVVKGWTQNSLKVLLPALLLTASQEIEDKETPKLMGEGGRGRDQQVCDNAWRIGKWMRDG